MAAVIHRVLERKWLKTEMFVSLGDIAMCYRPLSPADTGFGLRVTQTIISALRINELMATSVSAEQAASFWRNIPEFCQRLEYQGVVVELQDPLPKDNPPQDGYKHRVIGISKSGSIVWLHGKWFPRPNDPKWRVSDALALDFEISKENGMVRCFLVRETHKSLFAIPLGLLVDETGDGTICVRLHTRFTK
jgi:hypothetical protein